MPRYKISIAYEGTSYCGWQKQPNGETVEETIEDALARILRQPVDIIGQGRTDSGVHAEGQTAHFDFPEPLEADRLLYALLGVLPRDIGVWDMKEVAPEFHARFDATSRHYRYQVALQPSPLTRHCSELVLHDLDFEAMRRCAEKVEGTHNFDSFTKPDNENPDSVCNVTRSHFHWEGALLIYRVSANRFVRHLVRRLIGTILQVGKGKRPEQEFMDMLEEPSKDKHGFGAPAKGLILEKVSYKKS